MRRHAKSLIQLIQEHIKTPKVGAEIGVYRGETTALLCQSFPQCKMIMVDTWGAWKPGTSYYDKHETMGRMTQEEWDKIHEEAVDRVLAVHGLFNVQRKTSEQASEIVENRSLDFVFIDADHTYASVKKDIQLWTPKVRTGGLIMGHDFKGKLDKKSDWGVSRAVFESFDEENVISKPGLVWAVIKQG